VGQRTANGRRAMSDSGPDMAEETDVAALAASDCPDGIAETARRAVDPEGSRWERELLLAVFEAFQDPTATRRDALRTADAVELLAGYRRTRTPFVMAGTDDATPPTRRRRVLLAGDSLLALAFETVGTLSVDSQVVEACFGATVRATEASARTQSLAAATDGSESGDQQPTREGDEVEFHAVVAELTAELGSVLGGASARTRREVRRCGRAIGTAIAREPSDGLATGVDWSVGRTDAESGSAGGRDRREREWQAVRRVLGSVEDAALRRELTAFVDGYAGDR